jgi:RNA polymerase sigma-70 factor (ECF subfamily)
MIAMVSRERGKNRAAGGLAWGMAIDDDLELFHRWAGGDVAAGQELVLRYYEPVYFFFVSKLADHLAVELTQDTFETVCKKASSLRIHASFASYLFGIARWKLVAHFRGQSRQGFDPLSDSFPDPGPEASITQLLDRRHGESTLVQALRQLPLDDQILIEMRIYEALRLREIAEILGVTKERVAARLAVAKRRLLRAAEGLEAADETMTTLSSYMKGVRAELARKFEEVGHGRER